MQYIFPDYYKHFKCIAGKCQNSCCIGWEIDIDPDTAAYYAAIPGEFGERLKENISRDGVPHFILGEKERCPFLNSENLCDIILTLGEEHLCGICTDHPRFRNELPGRLETGIGLCCEEAARLILTQKEPVKLIVSGEDEGEEDELLALRDEILLTLQDRTLTIPERIDEMLSMCGTSLPERNMGEWAELLLGLERLDKQWTAVLRFLKAEWQNADDTGFDAFMSNRQTEYEQLLVYLIYRHFANGTDLPDAAARACFAALAYQIVHAISAAVWTIGRNFTVEAQIELVRLFSSEIEYSEENLDFLLDELYDPFA